MTRCKNIGKWGVSVLTQAGFIGLFTLFSGALFLEARADEVQDAHREKNEAYNSYYRDLGRVKTPQERAKLRRRIEAAKKKQDEAIQKKSEAVSREAGVPSDYPAAPDRGSEGEVDAPEGLVAAKTKPTATPMPSAAAKKEGVVLDGSGIPNEVEFSGKPDKRVPHAVPDADNPDYIEFEGKKPQE